MLALSAMSRDPVAVIADVNAAPVPASREWRDPLEDPSRRSIDRVRKVSRYSLRVQALGKFGHYPGGRGLRQRAQRQEPGRRGPGAAEGQLIASLPCDRGRFLPPMFAMKGIYENLIPGLWTAWIIYWWISARNVKATRREENAASRASHFVPLVIAVMLIAPARLPGNLLGARFLPASFAAFATGAALVAAGMALSIWARIHLGRNWSGNGDAEARITSLMRGGPYRFVRHPIYTGLLAAHRGFGGGARRVARGLVAVVDRLRRRCGTSCGSKSAGLAKCSATTMRSIAAKSRR